MPRNPKAPPYRSKHVISKSKKTQKHMTTIPKPIMISKWDSWNVKKADQNRLIWFPSGYDEILNHLIDQWKLTYSDELKLLQHGERTNLFITYDTQKTIKDISSWKVVGKKSKLSPGKKWKWEYKAGKTEYLIHVLSYNIKEDLMRAQFGENHKKRKVEELDVLYATVSLDLAKINPEYWANLLRIKEIIETAIATIISNATG